MRMNATSYRHVDMQGGVVASGSPMLDDGKAGVGGHGGPRVLLMTAYVCILPSVPDGQQNTVSVCQSVRCSGAASDQSRGSWKGRSEPLVPTWPPMSLFRTRGMVGV